MGKRRRNGDDDDNGFAEWGGYMEAKKTKLLEQFSKHTDRQVVQLSDILKGIAIYVNGHTKPSAEDLKVIMAEHGGVYHTYQCTATTHIIASNLPNVKINKLGSVPIVKPGWIEDSITLGRLLDYSKYLLYTNRSRTQPRLNFKALPKNETMINLEAKKQENGVNPEVNPKSSKQECSSIARGQLIDSQVCTEITSKLIESCREISTTDFINVHNNISNSIEESSKRTANNLISPSTNMNQNSNSIRECKSNSIFGNNKNFDQNCNNALQDSSIDLVKNSIKNIENDNQRSVVTVESSSKITKTASDPQFLAEFYNNSRLHLISTLGAEFKQLVNDMREKRESMFPGLEKLLDKRFSGQGLPLPSETVIMHIDMDCFFVSVGLRNRPELHGKPVAVTHSKGGTARGNVDRQAEIAMYTKRLPNGSESRLYEIDNTCSMSEIASCSYEARRCGIKNGMFMGPALKLCPDLKAIPYDFQGYREVSKTLYTTISEYTLDIEAVSCDEMYVDVTHVLKRTGLTVLEWATHIRSDITARTGCPCSAGFGANRLQARLATRKAKPNGWFHLKPEDVVTYMSATELIDLPGVGRATLMKLKSLGLETCGDVQMVPLSVLRKELGLKVGETIADQAKGIDKKPLKYEHERKSVSAEVNYGIRFKNNEEAAKFLESLSTEVHSRLQDVGMRGKCVTLKLMIRAQDAPMETAKYLGHGVCDSISRSSTLNVATRDPLVIFKEAKTLYDKLGFPFTDLRGVGIQLSRLEKEAPFNNVLKNFLNKPTSNLKSNESSRKLNTESKGLGNESKLCPPEKTAEESSKELVLVKGPIESIPLQKINKKGRPKGSKNVKTELKNTNNLSNYFRTTQKDRDGLEKNKLAPILKIDLSVLDELPADIREEIIREYKLEVTTSKRCSPVPQNSRETTDNQLKGLEKCSSQNRDSKKTSCFSFESLPPGGFKTMIKNWLDSDCTPQLIDIDMLGDYFKKLATERKIKQLHVMINFFHRHVEEKSDCVWHEVYHSIIRKAQEGMVLRYGGMLCAPRAFGCPHHK